MTSIPLNYPRVKPLAGLVACILALGIAAAAGQDGGGPTAPKSDESGAALALPPEILDVTWEWIGLQTPKEEIVVDKPANYTLTFAADGSMALQVDCNRGVASYTLSADQRITITPIATTMMACLPGSLDRDFTTHLERVNSFFQLEGDLLLEQPFDSGTMRFRPASAAAGQETQAR